MRKSLGYFSISHKTATVSQREIYQVSKKEKQDLFNLTRQTFPDISGLFMLVTCNRTEIYFESSNTKAEVVRDFFIAQKVTYGTKVNTKLFEVSDSTEDTARHILEVASGLESSVLGDAEIIHQIKKAHLFSLGQRMQGSLLERAMQTVFKCHKRINNETHFRDGTTSLAYKTLKLVSNHFKNNHCDSKKILFIGAGDIVIQLFKYNSKFNFGNIYLSNRTQERAIAIANQQQCKVFDWNKVLENDFEEFDVIISAVSNRQNLIHQLKALHKKILLIDLAVPMNIDENLAKNKNIIYSGLDCISEELEANLESRLNAVDPVNTIITEVLSDYSEWLQESSFRESLAKQKQYVTQKLQDYFKNDVIENSEELLKIVTNRILKKIINGNNTEMSSEELDAIIFEQYFSASEALV
jgi:glutamyl-tRNA reductase